MDPSTLKILQGAAGAAGASTIGVEDVFKTYVYAGNDSTQAINNGIDLAGEGGLVWCKPRSIGYNHSLFDTVSGHTSQGWSRFLQSNTNAAQGVRGNGLNSFNSNGFTLGSDANCNAPSHTFASWTFRKQEKFFDIVTYSGTGSVQNISHSLGSVPGMILIKSTSSSENWLVYHRGTSATHALFLNSGNAANQHTQYWNDTEPTSTQFTVKSGGESNDSGKTYIAYLFAHEEAEFGPDSDQKIISCGSYTGNGSATARNINLGFESQWIMIKNASSSGNGWMMYDTMRGWFNNADDDRYIMANEANAETTFDLGHPTSTGFEITTDNSSFNASGDTYIYIAIAAETGKTMKAIETGSDVFAMDTGNSSSTIPAMDSGFPVDMALWRQHASTEGWSTGMRLMGTKYMVTNTTAAESSYPNHVWDSNAGILKTDYASNYFAWMWKRNAGMDVVAYTGNSTAGRQIPHNLSKTPEMIWVKSRSNTFHWVVGHKGLDGGTNPWEKNLYLNDSSSETDYTFWNDSAPSATHFTVGNDDYVNGSSSKTYIAMLFASVDGISKVGYFDGSSSAQTITTGFQPRFLMIKGTTVASDWFILDTTRGWSSGNDTYIMLNANSAQASDTDFGAPTSTGFTLTSGNTWNSSGNKFIYYAHA